MKWLIHTEAKGPVIRANREVSACGVDGLRRTHGAVVAALGIRRQVDSHIGSASEDGEAKGRAGGKRRRKGELDIKASPSCTRR